MALITQKTNLKSLNYGGEKPYVTKDINTAGSKSGLYQQSQKRLEDLERISKALVDKPGGKFVRNQALLLQTDIRDKISKLRSEGTLSGEQILSHVGQTAKKTAQVIGSTLAQVPVNGTGTHFIQGFRTNTYLKKSTRSSDVADFLGKGGVEGSQYALRGEKIPTGKVVSNFESGEIKDRGRETDKYSTDSRYIKSNVNPIEASTTGEKIITDNTSENYNSSVESKLTEKETQYREEERLDKESTKPESKEGKPIPTQGKQTTKRPGDIGTDKNVEGEFNIDRDRGTIKQGDNVIQDFRNPSAKNSRKESNTYFFDYRSKNINKESRVRLGRQGKKIDIDPEKRYSQTDPEAVDKINQLGVLEDRPSLGEVRDLINFNIQVLTPETTRYLHFRAYLDSFDDNHTAIQEETRYVGRGDAFYTYGGYSRTVNVGFKIAASTRAEMKPLYQKINYLASATAPTYSSNNFMRGTLVKVTIGDYLYEAPSVLTNVSYSWKTDYPWEISMSNPEGNIDDDMQVVPHILDCSFSVNVIHQFTPETGNNPFITNPVANTRGKEVWIPGN